MPYSKSDYINQFGDPEEYELAANNSDSKKVLNNNRHIETREITFFYSVVNLQYLKNNTYNKSDTSTDNIPVGKIFTCVWMILLFAKSLATIGFGGTIIIGIFPIHITIYSLIIFIISLLSIFITNEKFKNGKYIEVDDSLSTVSADKLSKTITLTGTKESIDRLVRGLVSRESHDTTIASFKDTNYI